MATEAIKEYPVELVNIKDLVFDKDNPNEMLPEMVEQEKESMRKLGYLQPIIIDQNNKIADGEHRVKIYKEFGKKQIQAMRVNCENDDKRRLTAK